ncbi:MAG: farnesyl diphosphate synthase [Eubacteriales bacterium]
MIEVYEKYQEEVKQAMRAYLAQNQSGDVTLSKAMHYTLENLGKSLRPVLCLGFCEAFVGDREKAMPFALALEMVHSYSLIHDDLPCMDDDDFRRGRASCHKAFDEATAVLTGDALLTEAFVLMTQAKLSGERVVEGISALGEASGKLGMISGQAKELSYEKSEKSLSPTEEERLILDIEMEKTGALFAASAYLGALAAGADFKEKEKLFRFGRALGSAFQIQDDLLDALGDKEKLGKPIGSDAEKAKRNYYTVFGEESAKKQMELQTKEALEILNSYENTEFLSWLVNYLCHREF